MSSKRNSRDHLFVRTQSQRTKRASQFSAIFGQVIHSRSHSFVLNVIQFTLSTRWNRRTCFIGSSTAAFRSAAEANNKLDITIRMCRDAHTTLRPSKTTRIWIVCKVWCVCVKTGTNLLGILFTAKIVLFISLFIVTVIIVVVDAAAVVRLPPSLVVIIVSLWTVNTVRCRTSFEPNPHSNVWRAHDVAIPLRIEISCDRCCCSRCWCCFFFLVRLDHTHTHTVGR